MKTRHSALAAMLLRKVHGLSLETARRHLEAHPDVLSLDPAAEALCIEDSESHLRHLAAALAMGRPELFDAYLVWAAGLVAGRGVDRQELVAHVETLAEIIASIPEADPDDAVAARDVVASGVRALSGATVASTSFLSPVHPHGALARSFLDALLAVDRRRASQLVVDAADDGVPIEALYLHVFQPCLREMGRLWETGEASIAQGHYVTAGIQLAMAQLYPRLFAAPRVGRSVLVSSIGGELHQLGGRMLADIFELRGWTSHFTGPNTPGTGIAQLAADLDVDVVAVSATLHSHLPAIEEAVSAVRAACTARILVGGRPFLEIPGLWETVGADGTAPDAMAAVERANDLMAAS